VALLPSVFCVRTGDVRRFLQITWPLLLPYTYTVVLLTTMGILRIFDMMWIMTQGGPAHATETVATYIFTTGVPGQRTVASTHL
jgi:ABC-type sugar transport system permease subunit